MIPIERDIPLPPAKISIVADLVNMDVGDAKHFKSTDIPRIKFRHRIECKASYYDKLTGKVFTYREQDGGVRVWRVS
jgi:hypothetical protein